MVSGTVHVEAVLKRKKYYDYFCWSEYRPIAQAVFSPVDASNAACGSMMNNTAWTSGKAYRINVRPKDDRRREWGEYTRTVSLHVVKMNGGNEVCRRPLGDVSVKFGADVRLSSCKTYADPHITTFNKIHYDSFGYGEFVLYRHKTLNYAVHAITYKCNGRASCNCGALIKIGNDVIRIDRCPKRRRRRSLPMKAYLFKNGELTPGTKFGIRGRTFIVTLPTGTRISVTKTQLGRVKFVNIDIKPSAADVNKVEGMFHS
ncbi:hypothetical protein NP493_1225g02042 [Ridgeia piscesae]|uniref:VWFD domain-containing protein n=1 Tax=Ridgeia piscesae TaxID=27915 RepID=A0AAD9KBT3_RIDPI|nr:hypothetical protein NP493_1225g02042 [Ridgeia piscesae]